MLRLSTGLQNFLLSGGCLKDAFDGGMLLIYSGAQPTTANDAFTGTLLATITLASGAHTNEVQSSGTVTLNTGAAGSVDTLTVNGIEIMGSSTAFNTSLSQTATDVATKINRNPKNKLFTASAAGAVITIKALPGLGTLPNTWVVASTVTTITKTDVNMASGVNSVNGLTLDVSASGTVVKNPNETWSGVAGNTGTAGYFVLVGPVSDAGALDSTATFARIEGTIATSGAELNMSSTSIVAAATQTISAFSLTEPAQ